MKYRVLRFRVSEFDDPKLMGLERSNFERYIDRVGEMVSRDDDPFHPISLDFGDRKKPTPLGIMRFAESEIVKIA